jgi:hypothetical protein
MGGRSSTTFAKLQKERARREKQAEKEQRRRQRSLDKKAGIVSAGPPIEGEDSGIDDETSENALQPGSEGNL